MRHRCGPESVAGGTAGTGCRHCDDERPPARDDPRGRRHQRHRVRGLRRHRGPPGRPRPHLADRRSLREGPARGREGRRPPQGAGARGRSGAQADRADRPQRFGRHSCHPEPVDVFHGEHMHPGAADEILLTIVEIADADQRRVLWERGRREPADRGQLGRFGTEQRSQWHAVDVAARRTRRRVHITVRVDPQEAHGPSGRACVRRLPSGSASRRRRRGCCSCGTAARFPSRSAWRSCAR